MANFNAALIKKIARMLESDHDGERAAAASKLTSIAKAEGKNVDEMLEIVYGGAGGGWPWNAPPRGNPRYQGYSDFGFGGTDNDFGFGEAFRRARRAAENQARQEARNRAEAAEEARRRAREEDEAKERAREEDEAKERARTRWQLDPADPRHALERYRKLHALYILTDWERDFLASIDSWTGPLTNAQYESAHSIVKKYEAFEKRNGEADAFWKA
jgi:hypothetical protein